VEGSRHVLACGDVAVSAAVTSAVATRWQDPTKEGRGSDRPSAIWRVPTSAIVMAFDALDHRTNKDAPIGLERRPGYSSPLTAPPGVGRRFVGSDCETPRMRDLALSLGAITPDPRAVVRFGSGVRPGPSCGRRPT
jgi:hypothetical protein